LLSLSGDGRTLVVTESKKAIVRNVDTGAKLHEFEHENRISSMGLSGDGKTLVTVEHGRNGLFGPEGGATVTTRNVDTGAELQKFKSEHVVTSSSLSGDGKTLLTVALFEVGDDGNMKRTVLVRDTTTGAVITKQKAEVQERQRAMAQAKQARRIKLEGQEEGDPVQVLMGVYELEEGKEVNARGVWKATGKEVFMYYASGGNEWWIGDREDMEAGKAGGWMNEGSQHRPHARQDHRGVTGGS
jgi:hypothetical protein